MHTLVLTFSTFLLVWHHSTPTQLSSQEKPDFSTKIQLNQMNNDYLPDCCPKAKFPPSPCHFPVLSHEDLVPHCSQILCFPLPSGWATSVLMYGPDWVIRDLFTYCSLAAMVSQLSSTLKNKQTNKWQKTPNGQPTRNKHSHILFKKFILVTFRKQVRWLKGYFKIRKKKQYLSPPPFNILKSQVAWSFTSLSSSSAEWPIYFLGEEL